MTFTDASSVGEIGEGGASVGVASDVGVEVLLVMMQYNLPRKKGGREKGKRKSGL